MFGSTRQRLERAGLRLSASIIIASTGLVACDQQAFFEGSERLEVDTSLEPGEHPVFPWYAQSEFDIDFGAPTAAELSAAQPAGAEPAAQDPWIEASDFELSVQWRLENTSDQEITAWVMLDGATEFYDWNPVGNYGLAGGEDADELIMPSLAGYYPRTLAPGEVLRGEFREDDFHEASYDLDVLSRFCGGPLAVLYNRHEVDPTGTEQVPAGAKIAGMFRIRLTLAASGRATLDYSVRVRDYAEILFDGNEDTLRYDAQPELYIPAGFAQLPPGAEDPGVTSVYCGTAP